MTTSRERLLTTINHREPDQVPFDLGATVVTGIQVGAYRRLRRHLGLPEKEIAIIDMAQQIVRVDEDVRDRLNVDAGGIQPGVGAGFELTPSASPDGRHLLYHDGFKIGWRMPVEGGMYYDMFDHPLAGSLTIEKVDAFGLPNPQDPALFLGMRQAALKVLNEEKRSLVVGNISAGIFELAMWMRGFADGYADWAGNPALMVRLLEKAMHFQLGYWEKVIDVLEGIPIDVVCMADDFAGQQGLLISPASYRRLLKPFHKEMADFIHARSEAKIFFHSCGSVHAILPDLVESGVDILNPVQVSAWDMDPLLLKREFGRDLCFWGGGVDTQNAFDENHTSQEVRTDTRKRLEALMKGGGFVFSTVHNIQGNVPPENIMAMWQVLQEYGRY
jgi:uroporphyrinogen decarboxylase